MAKNLIEVLEELEFTPVPRGERWVINCPLHEDDNDPSFTIYPNQTYFCWGCKAWGDAVKFLIDYKGMSNQEALDFVGHDYQLRTHRKSSGKIVKLRDVVGSWKFLGQAAQKYHEYLKQQPGAVNYLHSRGLTDETIAKYKLGYTDGYVLNYQFAEEYSRAVELGLLHKDGYELLSHRITIPNILEGNDVDFITGRTVINNKLKYLNTHGSKPIQGFFEVRKSPVVFLTEGQMDWLMLRQWEWPAAVMAGSHLTKANQSLLESKHIVLVADNDEVGRKSIKPVVDRYENVTVLDYSEFGYKDISEFAQMKNAERIFIDLVREQCNWIFSFSTPTLLHWFKPLMREPLFQ